MYQLTKDDSSDGTVVKKAEYDVPDIWIQHVGDVPFTSDSLNQKHPTKLIAIFKIIFEPLADAVHGAAMERVRMGHAMHTSWGMPCALQHFKLPLKFPLPHQAGIQERRITEGPEEEQHALEEEAGLSPQALRQRARDDRRGSPNAAGERVEQAF